MSKKLLLSILLCLTPITTINPVDWNQIKNFISNNPEKISKFLNDTFNILILYGSFNKLYDTFITKDNFKLHKAGTIKESLANVGGNTEAKQKIGNFLHYLTNPADYITIGARPPKGILLIGKPGTGKTLLARALAGQAECAFIECSGSSFRNKFIGAGTDRVKKLFELARKNAPCIVFIDEFDSIGQKRLFSENTTEDSHILNQLLTEMDGFAINQKPILVLAATNNADVLDEAAVRAGRFDNKVYIQMPNEKEREEILKIHLKKVKHSILLDISSMAKRTGDFSGADLADLVNKAATMALAQGKTKVDDLDFNKAFDQIKIGSTNSIPAQTEQEKEITAYHEAGHCITALLLENKTQILDKITIVGRGSAIGYTQFLPIKDNQARFNRAEFITMIQIFLAGKAAEEIIFNQTTTGASNDLQKATNLIQEMICKFGMSNVLGNQVLTQPLEQYSEQTRYAIESATTKFLDEQYTIVKTLLITHKNKLEKLAKTLLKKGTLSCVQVYNLLDIMPAQELDKETKLQILKRKIEKLKKQTERLFPTTQILLPATV